MKLSVLIFSERNVFAIHTASAPASDDSPTVEEGKSPGPVYVRPEYEEALWEFLQHGVQVWRTVGTKWGRRRMLKPFKVRKPGTFSGPERGAR